MLNGNDLSFEEWDAQIKLRGVAHKTDKQLQALASFYPVKTERTQREHDNLERTVPSVEAITDAGIERQRLAAERAQEKAQLAHVPPEQRQEVLDRLADIGEQLDAVNAILDHPERLQAAQEKLARLDDKYACVLKEIEFRKKGLVKRKIHGTTYYIDLDNGDDAKDGLSPANAWKTIEKYTTVTARSAGDIAKVRANTSETPSADINFDEDGTVNSLIEIKGCSSTDDPWEDGSDVKPIITFGDASYQFAFYGDNYWKLTRLDVKESGDGAGAIRVRRLGWTFLEDCDIHDNDVGGCGVEVSVASVRLTGCSLYSNGSKHIYETADGYCELDNCTLNGGVATTDYGIYSDGGMVRIKDSTLGATTEHSGADIYLYAPAERVELLNSILSSTTKIYRHDYSTWSPVYSEDDGQTKGAQKADYYHGTISKDSVVQLDSLDSAKMEPNDNCGLYCPLTLAGDWLCGDYQIWCPASETTISIKARETAAWGTDPSSSEFYMEASYLNHATNATRSTQASSQSLSGTTEVTFTMTFTPLQAGWVYVTVYLKKYESGKAVNVSVKPAVS